MSKYWAQLFSRNFFGTFTAKADGSGHVVYFSKIGGAVSPNKNEDKSRKKCGFGFLNTCYYESSSCRKLNMSISFLIFLMFDVDIQKMKIQIPIFSFVDKCLCSRVTVVFMGFRRFFDF